MRNRKGFTFIEMLIAITIFSLIATGLYGALRSGYRLWQRSNERARVHQNWRSFDLTLSRDLRNAVDYSEDFLFLGEAHRMAFMTLMPDYRTNEGAARLVYVIYDADAKQNALIRKIADVSHGFDEKFARETKQADLDGALTGLQFDYCYAGETDTECAWLPKWEDLKPPRFVRLRSDRWEKTVFIPLGVYGESEE